MNAEAPLNLFFIANFIIANFCYTWYNKIDSTNDKFHVANNGRGIKVTDKKSNLIKNIILAILMIMVGVTVSVQFRVVQSQKKESALEESRKLENYEAQIEKLTQNLKSLREEYQSNLDTYSQKLNLLAENDSTFYSTLKTYHESINRLKADAGLTDVQGEGITVTVSDSINASSDVYNSTYVVHDTTLMQLVNDLKLAGAEAISVNDERVVALTEFICVGPAVKVNGTKLFAPFTIKAIGLPSKLETAIRQSSVITNPNTRLNLEISQVKELSIGAYNKSYKNNIALLQDYE